MWVAPEYCAEYGAGIGSNFLLKNSITLETRQGKKEKEKSQSKANKVKLNRLQVILPGF